MSGERWILWIEDDYFQLKGLIKPLQRAEYHFEIASSYVEAISYLQNWQKYSLIILDLILPFSDLEPFVPQDDIDGINPMRDSSRDLVENGVRLFDEMKSNFKITIPILLLTIVNQKPIVDELLKVGGVRRLPKLGLLPSELKEIVLEVLDK